MEMSEADFGGARPVDGYGPGFFRLGDAVIRGPVAVLPSGLRAWGGFEDAALLLAEAGGLDVLFVGTGGAHGALPQAFRAALETAGIPLEAMATPPACRTYNVLLAEGRRVGLAAIPV